MSGRSGGRSGHAWVRYLALVLAAAVAAGSLWYSGRQIDDLRRQTRRFTQAYAELIGHVATDTTGVASPLDLAVSRMIAGFDFPFAVTDTSGNPLSWRGLDIPVESTSPGDFEAVREWVARFDRQFEPIPLRVPGSAQVFHYGDPPAVRRLRLVPYIQLGLLALILALVWWTLVASVERQRSLVWVGLARESAHQFGTPLSSLQGWMRLLSERTGAGADGRGEGPATAELVAAMEEDVERLGRITSRFAKIGRPNEGEVFDPIPLIQRVVAYMKKRAPQLGALVRIEEEYQQVPGIRGHTELLEWVLENLLKNALDALGGESGSVRIEAGPTPDGSRVRIRVTDTGSGIAASDHRHIFDAGFTSKRRGWGLGLPLARRLAEAHGGRLVLVRSRPGEGSVFEVELPAV